jgi:hypothetical protein
MTPFSEWLGQIGLSRYAVVFAENAIDFDRWSGSTAADG